MSNKYVSFRIRRNNFHSKKVGKVYYKSYAEQLAHDIRTEKTEEGYFENPHLADLNLSTKFFDDIDDDNVQNVWSEIQDDYKSHWHKKMPSNVSPILSGLVSFSATMQEDINKFGRDELNKAVNQFLRLKFGKSMIYNTLQMEEGTPHLQFAMFNYDYENHRTISNTIKTDEMQTEIAKFLQDKIDGFDYVRGVPKAESQAKHLEVRQSQQISMQKKQLKIMEMTSKISEQNRIEEEQKKQIEEQQERIAELEKIESEAIKGMNDTYEVLVSLIDDIIILGDESTQDKAGGFLKTAKKYIGSNSADKLDNLVKKAERIRTVVQRQNNLAP